MLRWRNQLFVLTAHDNVRYVELWKLETPIRRAHILIARRNYERGIAASRTKGNLGIRNFVLEIGKRSNIIKNPTSGRERNGSYRICERREKKQVGETESTLDERKKAPHTKERKIFFLKSDPGWTQNKKSRLVRRTQLTFISEIASSRRYSPL